MTRQEFSQTLGADRPPAGLAAPLEALWWDAKRDWDRAHSCAQRDDGREAARVHAYLHRKEGDAGNAAYWYAQAAVAVFAGSLENEWQAVVAELLGES